MKKYLFLVIFVFGSITNYAQNPSYQTYSADLLIIATKDGENYQWKNKNIVVTLDYKTGNLKAIVNKNDFYNSDSSFRANENNKNSMLDNNEYIFEGNMPINQILNQKTINQDYDIELQLTNQDIDFSNTVNFKMNIMRPSQESASYRVFTLTGKLYVDELKLPTFDGYDNTIEIRIIFNAFWNG